MHYTLREAKFQARIRQPPAVSSMSCRRSQSLEMFSAPWSGLWSAYILLAVVQNEGQDLGERGGSKGNATVGSAVVET